MMSPVVWAVLWWACCHVTWLEATRQSTETTPQEHIDGVIDRAVQQMGTLRELRPIKSDWEDS